MTHDETGMRALLGPADPAARVPVPPPALTARQLIALAGQREAPRNGRRLLIAAGVLAAVSAAAGTVYGMRATEPTAPKPPDHADEPQAEGNGLTLGPIVRPLALEFAGNSPGATDKRRSLAGRIVAAPFESA